MKRKQLYLTAAGVVLFGAVLIFLLTRILPSRQEPAIFRPSGQASNAVQPVLRSPASTTGAESVTTVSQSHATVASQPVAGPSQSSFYRVSAAVMFNYDKAAIRPEAFPDLDQIGQLLGNTSYTTARIEMHTDRQKKSSAAYSKRLSQKRAEAVKMYFVEKFAIDPIRLEAVGCGFDSPLAPNEPVSGNPANRRVDIYVVNCGSKGNLS